jgi:tetratricopeptide (TPR) repeat protein
MTAKQPYRREKQAELPQQFQQAANLYHQGELDQALATCKAILLAEPNHVDTVHLRGVIHYQQGQVAAALDDFSAALKMQPANLAVLSNVGAIYASLGDFAAALVNYDKMLAIQSDDAETLNSRGEALMKLTRPEEALASFDRALLYHPDHAETLSNRGNALLELSRPAEALASYDKALALKPDYAEAYNNRGNALMELRRFTGALASYDKACALKPDYTDVLINRGNALKELSHLEEALASYDRALAFDPGSAESHLNKGTLLAELGQLDAAVQAIETAIELAPRRARFYYNLTVCKQFRSGDIYLEAMEKLAQDIASFTLDEQISLHFGLGKALADIGEHERSFQHLQNGNALMRKQILYDETATLELFERTKIVFTSKLMRRDKGLGDPSSAPIFILGMPRSGTSLIEQILASHPQVFGAGEVADLSDTVVEFSGTETALYFPEYLSRLTREQLRQLGTNYVNRLRMKASAAERVTNKTPDNFRFIGLIHMALPNARIIHVRRDPIDTCLSCFSKWFAGNNLPYTYDLAELGRFYRAYESLMAHWRSVLPPGVMIDLQYEEVVADLEGQVHRILAHCGLEWDPHCLAFHKTARQVRTASRAQVRRPIYKSSVGRWLPYEQFLGPLFTALKP